MIEKIELSQDDFEALAVCSLRYCQGRQTYMPSLICGIVRLHLQKMSDRTIYTMLRDCEWQAEHPDGYGNEKIDKPGWIKFKKALEEEKQRRNG